MKSDVEAPCSERRKHCAISGKSPISCHPSRLEGGVGVVEWTVVSGLSRRVRVYYCTLGTKSTVINFDFDSRGT